MTAIIRIKKRDSPIEVSDEFARIIKLEKYGDPKNRVEAKSGLTLIDLGDEWAGNLSEIQQIEILKERKEVEPDPPLTDEERENNLRRITEIKNHIFGK